ncbi:hypothetical protein ES705_20612 [subsurface metagenome]
MSDKIAYIESYRIALLTGPFRLKKGVDNQMKINKKLANSLHRLAKKGGKTIKEKTYPKINLFSPGGRVIGEIGQGESVDYNELLLKKRR